MPGIKYVYMDTFIPVIRFYRIAAFHLRNVDLVCGRFNRADNSKNTCPCSTFSEAAVGGRTRITGSQRLELTMRKVCSLCCLQLSNGAGDDALIAVRPFPSLKEKILFIGHFWRFLRDDLHWESEGLNLR